MLNKVKDQNDNDVLWINLGYATVNSSGVITSLVHSIDLLNNYPGGMKIKT